MADKRRNLGIPSGVVFPFAGNAAPYGYLICDGRAISRSEYPQLFLAIGTSHGIGDGSTTFNLPDYRGNFLRGRVDVTTITGSGTAASNNATFTNHGINRTGFKVRLSSGTLSGLTTATDYYAIVVDSNTLAFATTLANALAGTKIAITGANSGVIVQFEDPDYALRSALTIGGISSNGIGSFQADDFKSHVHQYNKGVQIINAGTGDYYDNDGANSFVDTTATGGTETRPKNVLVNYIIKV